MSKKSKAGFIGGVAVLVILALHSVEHWTLVDAVITGLRRTGSAGDFIVNVLLSPELPLALGIAAIYLAFEGAKEREDSKTAGPVSQSTTATGGNATASIGDIHLYPSVPQAPTPIEKPRSAPEPNMQCLRVRTINMSLRSTSPERYSLHEMDHETDAVGLVASFRNVSEYGREFCNAESVTAHLSFKDENGEEINTGISRACWLNSDMDLVDIRMQETQHVVLLGCGNKTYYFVPYQKRTPGGISGDTISTEDIRLDMDSLRYIEITLIGDNSKPLLRPVTVEVSKDGGLTGKIITPSESQKSEQEP